MPVNDMPYIALSRGLAHRQGNNHTLVVIGNHVVYVPTIESVVQCKPDLLPATKISKFLKHIYEFIRDSGSNRPMFAQSTCILIMEGGYTLGDTVVYACVKRHSVGGSFQ
jgi:hypothetical protein